MPGLKLISGFITPAIMVLMVLLLIAVILNYVKLRDHYFTISNALNGREVKKKVDSLGNVTETTRKTMSDVDTIHSYENKYNGTKSVYETISQLIPVFPLMGILGTVAGLMAQTTASNSADIVGSLNVALGSTFWGLIASIILKLVITLFNARVINSVDNMLDAYDTTIRTRSILNSIQNDRERQDP